MANKEPRVTNGYDKLPKLISVPHTQSDGEYEYGTQEERQARAEYWEENEHPLHKALREAGEEIQAMDAFKKLLFTRSVGGP